MRPAWLPCMQSHGCHPSVPALPQAWRAHVGSGRTHRPQDLGVTQLSLPVCPSPTLSSSLCTIASASCIFDWFFFFSKPFQAPAHTTSISPPIPTGPGIFGGKNG